MRRWDCCWIDVKASCQFEIEQLHWLITTIVDCENLKWFALGKRNSNNGNNKTFPFSISRSGNWWTPSDDRFSSINFGRIIYIYEQHAAESLIVCARTNGIIQIYARWQSAWSNGNALWMWLHVRIASLWMGQTIALDNEQSHIKFNRRQLLPFTIQMALQRHMVFCTVQTAQTRCILYRMQSIAKVFWMFLSSLLPNWLVATSRIDSLLGLRVATIGFGW